MSSEMGMQFRMKSSYKKAAHQFVLEAMNCVSHQRHILQRNHAFAYVYTYIKEDNSLIIGYCKKLFDDTFILLGLVL